MSYTGDSPWVSRGQVDRASVIDAFFADYGQRVIANPDARKHTHDGTYHPSPPIGQHILDYCGRWNLNSDLAAGQCVLETAGLQSTLWIVKRNPAGLGAEDDDPLNKSITFATPEDGIRAWLAHVATYVHGEGEWTQYTPRYRNVKAAGWVGIARTPNDLAGRYATDRTYGPKVAERANQLLTFAAKHQPEEPPMSAATDRLIAGLIARGRETIDWRGQLPNNPKTGPYPALAGGLGGVQYLIQHWTGDRFSRDFLRQTVGTDYGEANGGAIPASMTLEDEGELIRWYHRYHQGLDGGSWPAIAYGVMAFPSGRLWVLHDIGTLTYHAYAGGNRVSYALCAPISLGAPPTIPQLVSLNHVWDLLCKHTPEIPADHTRLIGHTEATILDAQNRTSCPGPVILEHVRRYRATGEMTAIELPAPDVPDVLQFADVPYVVGGGFKTWLEAIPAPQRLPAIGLPQANEERVLIDGYLRTVQRFERVILGWYPEGSPDGVPPDHPFHVRVLTRAEQRQVEAL